MSKDTSGRRILQRVRVPLYAVMRKHVVLQERIISSNLHVSHVEVLSHENIVECALCASILHRIRRVVEVHIFIGVNIVVFIVDDLHGGICEPL